MRASPVLLLCFAALLAPAPAWAANCTTWTPNFYVNTTPGHASQALRLSWTLGAPAACTNATGDNWDGTDHLEAHRVHGTSAPSNPSSRPPAVSVSSGTSQADDYTHRADTTMVYRIFACEDAGCTSWYGDGSGNYESTSATSDYDTTEVEKWVIKGVTDETDTGNMLLKQTSAGAPLPNAPQAFYYPSGWGTGLEGRLALYYSELAVSPAPSKVLYMFHDFAGWPAGGFNTSAYWLSPVLVATGSTDSGDDDYNADHPWSMLTIDGSDKRVQLFVQSQDPASGFNQAIQIESADEVGDDFGLSCGATTCTSTILDGSGYIAIEADGTSATDYVADARHSRITWDYIANGYIDTAYANPRMLFQLERPASGSCNDTGNDDIGLATGSWDSGAGEWTWDVANGGSPACPIIQINDGHDVGTIPMPNGELKVYYKSYTTNDWHVTYWTGSAFEDDSVIEVWFDDGFTTPPDAECLENAAPLVFVDGAGPHEGMFLMVMDSLWCGATGMDDDGLGSNDDSGIVFAILTN
jgi:hypothetical protein